MNSYEVTDAVTGDFVFNVTGHRFLAIPCVDANDLPTEEQSCGKTVGERNFASCTTSGCHGDETAALSALLTAEGLAVGEAQGLVVALETALTEDLIREGRLREIVHRLQNLRKEAGLAVTDRIHVEYRAAPGLARALQAHGEMIRSETLAVSLAEASGPAELGTSWDVDGESIQVSLKKA